MNETELLEKIISKLSSIEFQLVVISIAAWITHEMNPTITIIQGDAIPSNE